MKHTKRERRAQTKRKEETNKKTTSKYHLPQLDILKKKAAKDDEDDLETTPFEYAKACTSNYYAKRKSLQESIRKSHDIDVLWRPKRGSITLPVGPEGRFSSSDTSQT